MYPLGSVDHPITASSIINPRHMRRRLRYLSCVCVTSLYMLLKDGYIDYLYAKIRRFSTHKFISLKLLKVRMLSVIFGLLAFYSPHTVHALTGCTRDNNPVCGASSIVLYSTSKGEYMYLHKAIAKLTCNSKLQTLFIIMQLVVTTYMYLQEALTNPVLTTVTTNCMKALKAPNAWL